MRIVLDLQSLQTESRYRGIGRYSAALAEAMIRNAGDREVWVVGTAEDAGTMRAMQARFATLLPAERIQFFHAPAPTDWSTPGTAWRRSAAEAMRESFIASLRPDIVHVSSLFEGAQGPAVTSIGRWVDGVTSAATLYDLIPLLNPDMYLPAGWVRDWYMDKLESLRRARLLLAISAHAREEGIGAAGLDPSRVVNIGAAVSPAFRPTPAAHAAPLLSRLGVHAPYVMYSGAGDVRKNLSALMEAFARLPRTLQETHQLLLVGKMHPDEAHAVHVRLQDLGIAPRTVHAGYVTDEELVALYGQAALFVLPSLHEGFGLPALEAMSCGTPTLGSDCTSIPEVIGREDALFDPRDPVALAHLMERALTTAWRDELRVHALEQSARFTWDACARTALDAFDAAVGKGSAGAPAAVDADAGYRGVLRALGRLAPAEGEDLHEAAVALDRNRARLQAIARGALAARALRWRIEGPFDSSYSLALLNRETARALDALGHDVALHSTEGPGDFDPSPAFLAAQPDVARMHDRALATGHAEADVCSRNLYPPRVRDMSARYNMLHHYAWEESGFPQAWVEDFNESLQGITCLSTHVMKVMVDNGVSVPLAVSGCGVDHWERIGADPGFDLEARSFRFLHVSSCFPRKGADVLLKAYGDAFSDRDDVSLVIKTFANPHNEIHQWLADARAARSDFPHVVVLEGDFDDARLKALYQACDVLVSPSRAEGYGLPMAEAMLSGLPVITTAWGGQLDFCDEACAWLVDYDFAPAQTHFRLFNSVWAEPRRAHLADRLREAHATTAEERRARADRGRARLLAGSRWTDVAGRLVASAREWSIAATERAARVGWVTTWNTKCGIATYSSQLVRYLPAETTVLAAHTGSPTAVDDVRVVRCWHANDDDRLAHLDAEIATRDLDVVVIQFQYGFFHFPSFSEFIRRLDAAGRTVVVMMHATVDPAHVPDKKLADLADALRLCDRVLVHSHGDLNRLKAVGLVDNVALFPHGVVDFPEPLPRAGTPFTVASYGFLLPHKGLAELVEAAAILQRDGRDFRLLMINAEYPIPASAELAQTLRERIDTLGLVDRVSLETDYLPDAECLRRLQQADLVVFPYQATGESSSAAVRYGLASGRPVAVTPLAIFDDVDAAVSRLPGTDPAAIAAGLARMMDAGIPATDATRWLGEHRYSRLGERMANLLGQLRQRRRDRSVPHLLPASGHPIE